MAKEYISANTYGRMVFGEKVYKLAMSAATTCPNRDGTLGTGGCIFCSEGGSGDFAAGAELTVDEQIQKAKQILGKKGEGLAYIAYYQSFTGTYGDLEQLEARYTEAARHPEIAGLAIATRPDCLGPDAMDMLERLAAIKPLWVELGLQTIHEETAKRIRRGYELPVYEEAMERLARLGVHRITHVILGLPGETREQMLETVRYVGEHTDGIKLQLLHVLKGTDLATEYAAGSFEVFEQTAYCELVADAMELLPEHVVIHRMTGDGAKRDLIAPQWSGNKKSVLNELNRLLRAKGILPKSIEN